jgi:hypothetical protein
VFGTLLTLFVLPGVLRIALAGEKKRDDQSWNDPRVAVPTPAD